MRSALVVLAGLAALALVPGAQAKGGDLTILRICGASGCAHLRPAVKLGVEHGFAAVATPVVGPYYVLRVAFVDHGRILERTELYFVPSGAAITGKTGAPPTSGWTKMPARPLAQLGAAAKAIKPFATPVPDRAYVNGRLAADAAPFAALLGPLEPAAMPKTGERLIWITMSWRTENPWSRDGGILEYLPRARVVMRPDGLFHVPNALADRIDQVRRSG